MRPAPAQAATTVAQGRHFKHNSISTTKYNLVTYLPKARGLACNTGGVKRQATCGAVWPLPPPR